MNGTTKEWLMGVFRTVVGTCMTAAVVGGWLFMQEFRIIVDAVERIDRKVAEIEKAGILPEARARILENKTRIDGNRRDIDRNSNEIQRLRRP